MKQLIFFAYFKRLVVSLLSS